MCAYSIDPLSNSDKNIDTYPIEAQTNNQEEENPTQLILKTSLHV